MRYLRSHSLCKFSFFFSLLVTVTVACIVPAARSQVQPRVNRATSRSEKPTTNTTTRNTGSPAETVDGGALVTGASVRGTAIHAQKTASTAFSPEWTPPIFLAPAFYSTGAATAVAVADVNGDGKPDLVAANCAAGTCSFQGQGTISVLLGNGDGTFQDAVNYWSGGWLPTSVMIADVNGDGKPDILVTNEGYGINILLGNGDGTFQPVSDVAGVETPLKLLVADINGDGKLDLVVLSGSIGVLLGNGDGTFQPIVSYEECIGCLPSSLAMADVNGDGNLDLLVAYWNGASIGIRLGNGDGTFQSETLFSVGMQPSSLAAADVNGDGHIDLVVTNLCLGGCNVNGTVAVLLGNGDGTFQTPARYGWDEYGAQSIAIADLNEDGKPDLVVGGVSCLERCGPGPSGIGVLLGMGDGTFQPTIPYSPSTAIGDHVLVADLNRDNRPDVVSINPGPGGFLQVWMHVGDIRTTTALTSSLNPSVFGQPVTLTANTGSSSGTPTGTVELFDSIFACLGSYDCGGGALVNESAVFSDVPLVIGTNQFLATYQGSLQFNSSISEPLNQVVQKATTTTSVVSSLNPATPARTVTYTATVTGQYGGGTSGTVTFSDGAATIATVTLASGQAAYRITNPSCGVHPITTTYSGDASNNASTSLTLNEYVQCSTSTSLATSGSPTFAGQPVTFTAKVTSKYGRIPDGDLLTFYDGTTQIGTGSTTAGAAAFSTSSLSAKKHFIRAVYAGDATLEPSSGVVVQVVEKYASSILLASSLNPSIYGQPVAWTATVTTAGPFPTTGTVNFIWSGNTIGTATLNATGVATLTRSNLNADSYPLTAVYTGDSNNLGSTSSIVNQVVTQATSSATLSSSPNPSTLGEAVTFAAKITSPTVTAKGPVTFTAGKTVLGTAQLSGGKATLRTSSLAAGPSLVTVTYQGDSDIRGSSDSVTQTVQ